MEWTSIIIIVMLQSGRVITTDGPLLLVTHAQGVLYFDLNSGQQLSTVLSSSDVYAVDYHYSDGQLYWAPGQAINTLSLFHVEPNTTHDTVPHDTTKPMPNPTTPPKTNTMTDHLPNPMPFSNSTILGQDDICKLDGMALDWVNQNLYWSDPDRKEINVVSMRTGHRCTLVSSKLDSPGAMAVDPRPHEGWMYWTDWGSRPRIEKAGLDGSYRRVIISDDISDPYGITIDYKDNQLYWADMIMEAIYSCNLEGQGRRTVLASDNVFSPYGITIFENFLYWTENAISAVRRVNKYTGEAAEDVVGGMSFPRDLKVMHRSRQPDGIPACSGSGNSGCSHLCVASPRINSTSPRHCCLHDARYNHTSTGDTDTTMAGQPRYA